MGVLQGGENDKNSLQLDDIAARVDRVKIKGLGRTKDDIVINSVNSIFEVHTFQQLLEKVIETRINLERLSCFDSVGITIDTSSGPGSTPDYGYDVTFNVKELGRIRGRVTTTIDNNQGSLGLHCQAPNLAGRGECIQVGGKCGFKEMKAFNFAFTKPLFYYNGLFSGSAFKHYQDNISAGYKLTEHGVSTDFTFFYTENVKHSLTWEGIIRNIGVLEKHVPFSVREQCGYTLKSAVRSTVSLDTRDSTVMPTSGQVFEIKSEVAGLGGNIGFVKNEMYSQLNIPLFYDITLQNTFAAGIMNLISKDKFTTIADNFFIGGPLTLRGFQLNGAGPKIESYSSGGSLYFLNAVHLYTPLPHRPQKGSFGDSFRVHFFCNMGNLSEVSSDLNECLDKLSHNFRLSYGVGLLYRFHQMARFELNYCIPVCYQRDDKMIDGVQFGFGIHFV